MSATIDDLDHTARLAALEIKYEEKSKFLKHFNSILDFVSQLQELDVDDIEPMAHPQEDKSLGYRQGIVECPDKVNFMKNVKHSIKNNGIVIKSPIKS